MGSLQHGSDAAGGIRRGTVPAPGFLNPIQVLRFQLGSQELAHHVDGHIGPFLRGLIPFLCGLIPFLCGLIPFLHDSVPFMHDPVPFMFGIGLAVPPATLFRVVPLEARRWPVPFRQVAKLLRVLPRVR